MRIELPIGTSATKFAWETQITSPFDFSSGAALMRILSPNFTESGSSVAQVLISGPLVSNKIPMFSETARVLRTTSSASSCSICAVLRRTTFIPAA